MTYVEMKRGAADAFLTAFFPRLEEKYGDRKEHVQLIKSIVKDVYEVGFDNGYDLGYIEGSDNERYGK